MRRWKPVRPGSTRMRWPLPPLGRGWGLLGWRQERGVEPDWREGKLAGCLIGKPWPMSGPPRFCIRCLNDAFKELYAGPAISGLAYRESPFFKLLAKPGPRGG